MNIRPLLVAVFCAGVCMPAAALDPKTSAFMNTFSSTCLKHLTKLGSLRDSLKAMPALPPEKASHFLRGAPGSAWPVPNKAGVFVLALPADGKRCSVFAQRVPADEAETEFVKLLSTAPAPLKARQTTNEKGDTAKNGTTRRIGFEWATDGAPAKMFFMLTTAAGQGADIQGLATASLVK